MTPIQYKTLIIIQFEMFTFFLHSTAGFVTEKAVAKTFGLLEMIMRKMIRFQWNRDSKFVSQIGLWLHQRIFYDCNISTPNRGSAFCLKKKTVNKTTNLIAQPYISIISAVSTIASIFVITYGLEQSNPFYVCTFEMSIKLSSSPTEW